MENRKYTMPKYIKTEYKKFNRSYKELLQAHCVANVFITNYGCRVRDQFVDTMKDIKGELKKGVFAKYLHEYADYLQHLNYEINLLLKQAKTK